MSSLAARLATARINGGHALVSSDETPANLIAAYALQLDVAARLGAPSDAWKVGSTSAEAQAKLGTTEPGAARVPARFRFSSGEDAPVYSAHDLWVEAEFALRLGIDLPPRDTEYTKDEIIAAIDGVAPALEIVGSRLPGGLSGAGRLLVTADGGANIALCTGSIVTEWRQIDLPAQKVQLHQNGEEVAAGVGAQALGDPVNVMLWIANNQRKHDGLKAGEMISTGTCTGLTRVALGDCLRADFGDIGDITLQLVDANAPDAQTNQASIKTKWKPCHARLDSTAHILET
jgi:2-keto-4-pentenoate hydratase